jgi:hypothetical protein
MVSYHYWSQWQTSPFISRIWTSLSSRLIGLCHSISGMLTNSLRELTSLTSKISMGRTFRREKTYGQRRPRLNNHRDLPDYQHDLLDEDDIDYFDEDLFNGKLHSQEQDVVGSENEPTGQRDQRQRKG